MFLASSKPSSLPASGVKRSLILWHRFSLVLEQLCRHSWCAWARRPSPGHLRLCRLLEPVVGPGAAGYSPREFLCSCGLSLLSGLAIVFQERLFWTLMFLALCHPAPTSSPLGLKGDVGQAGPVQLSPPCAMPTSVWLF